MTAETQIAFEVLAEIRRQVERWGEQNHPNLFRGHDRHLYGHQADQWKQKNTDRAVGGCLGWDGILLEEVYEALAEEDPTRIRAELVQVAAVAMNWIGAIDRREQLTAPKEPR